MKTTRLWTSALLALVACAGCKSSSGSNPDAWTAKDLGAGKLVAINSKGTLLGIDPAYQSFTVGAGGARTPIPPYNADSITIGSAIGEDGTVVGYAEGSSGRVAVRTVAGVWTAIPGVGTASGGWGAAIGFGSSGEILGVAGTGAIAEVRAFSLSGSTLATLPLPADKDSAAYTGGGGSIAGVFETPAGDTHAFLITAGALKDLGTLGGANSAPYGMNGAGDVVGVSEMHDGSRHAFHAAAGGAMTDLGLPPGMVNGDARGIDESGRIAGNGFDAMGLAHPFVYLAGKAPVDLTPLDAKGVPFASATVVAMSADGHIVGWGIPKGAAGGVVHAILWTAGE